MQNVVRNEITNSRVGSSDRPDIALADMATTNYEDVIEPVKRVDDKAIVTVNGKEVVVSSATQKPTRSVWVAWAYIFDVSFPDLQSVY